MGDLVSSILVKLLNMMTVITQKQGKLVKYNDCNYTEASTGGCTVTSPGFWLITTAILASLLHW